MLKNHSSRHKRRKVQSETGLELSRLRKYILSQASANENIENESVHKQSKHEMETAEMNFSQNNVEEISAICNELDLMNEDFVYQYSDSECSDIEVLGEELDLNKNEIDAEIENEQSFQTSIKSWALDYNIKHNALKSLLQILNEHTNVKFSKDPRTILRTPNNYKITDLSHGQYCHLGFKKAIERCIDQLKPTGYFQEHKNTLEFFISTDGAPLGKSSGLSMWPILCQTFGSIVQVIGIFVGESKPKDSNEFFAPFIEEMEDIQENGLTYDEVSYSVFIKGLIFDAPAKAFALNVKYHSGYNSCTKCTIYGVNISNTVCFPNEYPEPNLRSDEGFRTFQYGEQFNDDYQKKKTILANINNLGLITRVPLDYMHLVCLGVMRKLILLWMQGPLKNRLACHQINKISEQLIQLRLHVPSEFPRKPRNLKLIKLWKATEFRNFLMYYGPVLIKNELNEIAYNHFLLLHVAIRLLADPVAVQKSANIACANELLEKFVADFGNVYEKKNISYNVHNLKHLSQDVRTFGCLDKFSAFPFENFICTLKRLIRKGDQPLQQLVRRLGELDNIVSKHNRILKNAADFSKQHNGGPLTNNRKYDNEFQIMHKNSIIFKSDDKNDCVQVKDNSIIQILNFAESEKVFYIIGNKFKIIGNLYEYPYESKLFNIFIVKKTNEVNSWPCSDIVAKMLKIPSNNNFIVFPILHTSEK